MCGEVWVVVMWMSDLDHMVAYSVAALASGDQNRIQSLVRDLAEDWPAQSALSVSFALTSAAAELEGAAIGNAEAANTGYRLASLVAADVMAIEAMGRSNAKTTHLLHFWRRVDPFFLKSAGPQFIPSV